jgi:uncharacterized protein (DUF2164 family)
MALALDDARKAELVRKLQGYFQSEFDEEISTLRAETVREFVLEALGPSVYNPGVLDARRFMAEKLDDLDVEIHERESA